MKVLKISSIVISLLVIVYVTGPMPDKPHISTALPEIKTGLNNLEAEIRQEEERIPSIKEDNQARIVWSDSIQKNKTPYSIVYIHGFSASQGEGIPLHREFAKRYGCNLYLCRLYEHGLIEKEPMIDLTPEKLLESAKRAVEIGKKLGDKVILMSTSSGGTLSLYIASGNPDIHSIITYSPNIDLYDEKSWVLAQPWGLQLARIILGGKYYTFDGPPGFEKYWTPKYRIESIISLKSFINATMKAETFGKIKQPVFMGYYYKNEEEQDKVVSVKRMLEMFAQLGTPDKLKRKINFPESGTHIIASGLWSKDILHVKEETFRFAEEILGMEPAQHEP
jgi:pimeloyl-ACP methyl ester carboxylesterase